jgi:hypothetical protein
MLGVCRKVTPYANVMKLGSAVFDYRINIEIAIIAHNRKTSRSRCFYLKSDDFLYQQFLIKTT